MSLPRIPDRPRVVFLQAWIRQYRARFYELLRQRLDEAGIDLVLVYGAPEETEVRGDTVELPWADFVDSRVYHLGPARLWWQPAFAQTADADLIVTEQATKRLMTWVIVAKQLLGGTPVAFWGHGKNFQVASASRAGEFVKRMMSRRVHWWFAYNDLSGRIVRELGFPPERITVVRNSIDTTGLAQLRRETPASAVAALRAELGTNSERIGIFVGALYPEKRIPFLLQAAEEIRAAVPDFELVVIGGGPDSRLVEAMAVQHDWVHYVGPKFGADLPPYFALGRVLLMPGLVGLAVLDSFVFETPLVTTTAAQHSPEIDYLRNGVNGIAVPGDGSGGTFGEAVTRVLCDDALHASLVAGCRAASARYSVEDMAERFARGIEAALRAVHRSPLARRKAGAVTASGLHSVR